MSIVWRASATSTPSFSTLTVTLPPAGRGGDMVRTAWIGTPAAKLDAATPRVHSLPPVLNPTDVTSGPPSVDVVAADALGAPDARTVRADGALAQPARPASTINSSPAARRPGRGRATL